MNNVLFISYFWPPSGKASLHWPLFIIKHLPKLGWMPSVLTVDEDSFSHRDESLIDEIDKKIRVVKTSANEPFNIYRKFLGKKAGSPLVASETISLTNGDWKHKLSIWIRMNLFVPDARIGWFLSALTGGGQLIESERPKAIVSIGPPHSSHLIGKKLSKQYNIPHIPVLIDPWVDIVYYRNFTRTSLTRALDNYFERSTFRNAAHIIFVTKSAKEDYLKKYPWIGKKSHVLYWGYNKERLPIKNRDSDWETILHAGNIFDYQNPTILWGNIKSCIDQGKKLRLRFIGTVSPEVKKSISLFGLDPYTDYVGFLPYKEALQEMVNATYLLVCATEKRHVPGKLFEYLSTGNKIIAFGDDNEEVKGILNQSHAGILFSYKYGSYDIFDELKTITPQPERAVQYSREFIAGQLAEILNSTI
jgi:glycosyltransferase involved in cell wall biosynthesis